MKKLLITAIALLSLAVNAMTFEVLEFKDGSSAITATGPIFLGDSEKFSQFLVDHPELIKGSIMSLHSGGGSAEEAQSIAYTVRYTGKFNTIVLKGNNCESACTDILLGGVERIGYEGANIGYHSAFIENYDDFTGHELLMLGQRFAIGDIYFALLYTDEDVPGWVVVEFFNEVFNRADNSIMLYPSMDNLREVGILTIVL